jgi:mono/diheme cytochrome c family protein
MAAHARRPWGLMRAFLFGVAITPVALLAAVLGAAAVGLWPVSAAPEPSALETRVAHFAVARALARRAPRVASPVPVTTANLFAGMKVYRDNCEGCHGGPDRAPSDFGGSFYPRVPQFPTDPPRRPVWQIRYVVRNGVRWTAMPGWRRLLSEDDMWRVATFVGRIDSLPPEVVAAWRRRAH